jgi:thiol:disulfide interchange protein
MALLAGSLAFFITLGAVTTAFGLMWGQLFQHPWFRPLLAFFLFAAASATFTGWSWRLPQVVYRLNVSRHLSAFLTGMLAGILSTPCSGPFLGAVLAFAATRSLLETMVIFPAIGCGLAFPYVALWSGPVCWTASPSRVDWPPALKCFWALFCSPVACFFLRDFCRLCSVGPPGWGLFWPSASVWCS